MDHNIILKASRFPFVYNGVFYDSILLKQNKTCLSNCEKKDCIDFYHSSFASSTYNCYKNFDCILIISESGDKVMINGVIIDDQKDVHNNRFRSKYRISSKETNFLIGQMELLMKVELSEIDSLNPQFSILHDIKTTYGIILSQVELLINKQEGRSFEKKIRNCEQELSDLYDAIGLANSQLGMIDVLVNPSKITHGLKRNINLFQLFERVSRLFRAKANKKNLTINWFSQETVPNSNYYDAIEFIPIVLLDNAIKYSNRDKAIKVYFNVSSESLKITCSSFGEYVHPDDRKHIFGKFKRGRNASKYSSEGIGIGLWILNQIVIAHEGTLVYEFEGTGTTGANNFIIELKTPPNMLDYASRLSRAAVGYAWKL